MILTKEQREEMRLVSKPLMAFLAENCHPHVVCHVDSESVEMLEGVARELAARSPETGKGETP
jgi:predicted RNA-binding protein